MRRFQQIALAAVCLIAVGCNAGMAPEGQSADQAKNFVDTAPLDKKVELLRTSPLPEAEKERRIKEAYEQAGQKYEPNAPAGGAAPGVPANVPGGKPATAGGK